jgi:hypothetical protein
MNKTEWKLLCVDAINICGRKNIDCLECEVRCTKIIRTAQKKLLEYLKNGTITINDCNGDDMRVITEDMIEAMLKQLEERK